jgi:hypothetical protein
MKTTRKNPQSKALTYEQVESRKDRGVEGLRRLGENDRASTLDDESVEDFAERKNITIINPRGKKKNSRMNKCLDCGKEFDAAERDRKRKDLSNRSTGYCANCLDKVDRETTAGFFKAVRRDAKRLRKKTNPRRRRNGEVEDAQKMFKKFHGRKSTTIEEVQVKQKDRRTMSGLGVLMFLRTDLTQEWNGKGVGLQFSEQDKVILASDPQGNQLYFLGGNQDVTGILPKHHVDGHKDFIDLGECDHIIYTTDKDFDNFEEKDYQHEFGEETGERPRLMFDRLNQQLYLIGGAYEVKREGIVN